MGNKHSSPRKCAYSFHCSHPMVFRDCVYCVQHKCSMPGCVLARTTSDSLTCLAHTCQIEGCKNHICFTDLSGQILAHQTNLSHDQPVCLKHYEQRLNEKSPNPNSTISSIDTVVQSAAPDTNPKYTVVQSATPANPETIIQQL